jgi:ABC-type proline/glycine betaine transport system ATPase subunit
MREKIKIRRIIKVYGMKEEGYLFIGKKGESVERMKKKVGNVLDNNEVKVVDEDGRMVKFG